MRCRKRPSGRRRCHGEGATVQFRVQFLDASGTIIQEMHADTWNAAGAIELVKGMEWPARAVRMINLNELGVVGQFEIRQAKIVRSTQMSATVQFTKQLAFNLILHKLPNGNEGGGPPGRYLVGGRYAPLSYEHQTW